MTTTQPGPYDPPQPGQRPAETWLTGGPVPPGAYGEPVPSTRGSYGSLSKERGVGLAGRLHDEKRTESTALTAFVLALVSLAFAPLAVPAQILTHWAARGSQRTVALVVGWLVSVGMVAAIIAVLALGAAANNAVNEVDKQSPYYQCLNSPDTTWSDCQGLSTSG